MASLFSFELRFLECLWIYVVCFFFSLLSVNVTKTCTWTLYMGHLQQTYTVHFHDFWPTCPFHDLSETIFGNISLKKLVTSIIYHSNFFVWPKLASHDHSELESAKIGYFELFFQKWRKTWNLVKNSRLVSLIHLKMVVFVIKFFQKNFHSRFRKKKFVEIHWSNMTEKSTKSEFWPHQVTIFQKSLKLKNEGLW